MLKYLPFISCLVLLFSCQSNKQSYSGFLNKDSLPSQFIQIDNTRDTSVTTANGAILKIQKGSFSSDKVRLQVKEAYTIEQMILAGLTTESNGRPLSSGGMIYISADDKDVKINKAIEVSLPTDFFDDQMDLYKGKEMDGQIKWTNPEPLKNNQPSFLSIGRALYRQNCANCHALDKDLTGPSLIGVELRGPWKDRKNLFAFTRDPAGFVDTSKYAQNEKCKYGIMMVAYPQLEDDALNAIYDYLKNETLRRGITSVDDTIMNCLDSCRAYDSVYRVINNIKKSREELIKDNGNRINYTRLAVPRSRDTSGPITKVAPGDENGEEHKAIYYQFDITSFGWYNIDRLLDYASSNESTLSVRIDDKLTNEFDVFIAVPAFRTFDRGGKLSDGSYGFLTLDGKIPLPVNTKVIVFAVGEANEKIVFDYKEFYSKKSNVIELNPKLVSKEEFNSRTKRFALDSINIQAKYSKNAEQIRQADKQIKSSQQLLESYRPKNCSCGCVDERPANDSSSK